MPFPQGIKDWEPCEVCNEIACFGDCDKEEFVYIYILLQYDYHSCPNAHTTIMYTSLDKNKVIAEMERVKKLQCFSDRDLYKFIIEDHSLK